MPDLTDTAMYNNMWQIVTAVYLPRVNPRLPPREWGMTHTYVPHDVLLPGTFVLGTTVPETDESDPSA